MENTWDIRYNSFGNAYGLSPNRYFEQKLTGIIPGKLLLPAEGEGRNAMYAAKYGWLVDAYDQSSVARKNAQHHASLNNVEINYCQNSHLEFPFKKSYYNAIALIFVHVNAEDRIQLHKRICNALAPSGVLILEAFQKGQVSRTSGGPKTEELLYDMNDLLSDFSSLRIIESLKVEVKLNEGNLHQGLALVNRIFAINDK